MESEADGRERRIGREKKHETRVSWCTNGYFGQPGRPGGSCEPCQCHDNLDLALPGSCDPITGQCLRCRQGYGGVACESCADDYYGDALIAQNCQQVPVDISCFD
ncbi:hypothetical protein NHX12_026726 [Muraenolepis orangiensis]|uniref:Laminin EGF-like domain-containing protein n=1 Tax=Muraenolepis orangiensis TaxID=630683 RepID=A0A9Q0IR18_9TELE|nr:hypothetical protein NHX12_026726 [Muraenolepis orangiensis]